MARYRLNQRSYINGALKDAGEDVTYDGVPGSNLEPLDDEAKKAKAAAKRAEKPKGKSSAVERTLEDAVEHIDRLDKRMEELRKELDEEHDALIAERQAHNESKAKLTAAEAELVELRGLLESATGGQSGSGDGDNGDKSSPTPDTAKPAPRQPRGA